ncbi:beta-glucosidase [Candidatus Xianfuyuplasma coldseepsis]|uniref:Glycosyl hydrolase n=1 Tax=Candidatus Xianfuyuplasma coldseepsis TaxID=2782163 RepID=A0A7L7KR46_9MOLU|nr:glycoside hydrolase family 3 C-terminal domain-containing protein [Xianfuyuplasma coldseepsis]QMS84424.1 glycosyl hydrolase [Xianfuyuplasma coldseepsis]
MSTNKEVLKQLTIDEKVNLTTGTGRWTFFGIPRLDMRSLVCGDGPHGLRAYKKDNTEALFHHSALEPTTLFPIATAMASTFHPELVHEIGRTIAKECNHHSVDLLLAPGVNLKRSPLGGRNFEYYSEDPYLTGVMASAYINGVQSEGVGACIKHYALNEQETYRRFINTEIDDRTLHEVYLAPFHYAIEHANPKAIMSSYNKIRGDYASESSFLLQDILRNRWNYTGLVMSDWGAVQHKVKSVKNGMNIEMPGPGEFQQHLHDALEDGSLVETELDASLVPLFDFYDYAITNTKQGQAVDLEQHLDVAYNIAKEAIVLLENDGILPLAKGLPITIIGERAKEPRINGGGSASLRPYKIDNPLDRFQEAYDVHYAQGYQELDTTEDLLKGVDKACEKGDVILFFTDATASLETEGNDRSTISIPKDHIAVYQRILAHNKPVIVVLSTGSSIDVTPFVGTASAMLQTWLLGSAHGQAIVDVISGDVNPSGHLTETFPMSLEQTPFYGQYPCNKDTVRYHSDLYDLGYRYYDNHQLKPRYPFGYGLSYSSFTYNHVQTNKTPSGYECTISITNTSDVDGKDVVQLYIGKKDSIIGRPPKTLQAFQKVLIPAHTKVDVTLPLTDKSFVVYNEYSQSFVVEPGMYQLYIGQNVQDFYLEDEIQIDGEPILFQTLTMYHPVKAFVPFKKDVIKRLEAEVGTIPWYNMEEPLGRILRRFKHRHQWTDTDYATWKKRFLEGLQ